jgi:hypothetical protein
MTIADYARKLLDGSNVVSDLLSAGSKAWDDISNGVQWLYDTVLGMVSWLQESVSSIPDIPEWIKKLPGDTSDAIKDWLQDSVESIPNGIVDWLKKLWDTLTSLPSSISSAITGIFPWGGSGAEEEGKKSSLTEAEREEAIQKAKSSRTGGGYKNFDFGMGSDIWDKALTEAETGIPQEVPNLQNRAEYERLVRWFRGELANKSSGSGGNTTPIGGEIEIKTDQWGNEYKSPVPPKAPEAPETFKNQGSMYVAFGDDGLFDVMNASGMVQRGFASEAAAKEYIANQTQYAIGATFKKDGLFAGLVHAPEEIIPQATAQRGAGPIARALDTLYGVTAGSRSSTSSQKTEVHVHNHNHNDFSGMRVSSDIDIEKLMKEIDRRIEAGSIAATHKAMGQRRT